MPYGNGAASVVRSSDYATIPHPALKRLDPQVALLLGNNECKMVNDSEFKTIRIPLAAFAQNGLVDLANIARITIQTENAGIMALDDIEVSN